MTEKVLAVVVTYNPKPDALRILLLAALSELKDIAIIDNGSKNLNAIKSLIDELQISSDGRIDILAQPANLGLGAAHNIGIKLASEKELQYVLLLDQDSVPMTDMVSNLMVAHLKKSSQTLVSATGVTYLNADNGAESFFVRFGLIKFKRMYCANRDEEGCIESDFLISSGSLISLESLKDIGEMDETLFIDHVDTEWFLRARNKGYKAYGVCDALMQHGLGETTHQLNFAKNSVFRKLFALNRGRTRNVPQHNPFRYYYIFRNSVLLYKRRYVSKLWVWNDVQRLCMIMVMFGLFKSPRRENLSMMLHGLYDGIRGVTGKLPERKEST